MNNRKSALGGQGLNSEVDSCALTGMLSRSAERHLMMHSSKRYGNRAVFESRSSNARSTTDAAAHQTLRRFGDDDQTMKMVFMEPADGDGDGHSDDGNGYQDGNSELMLGALTSVMHKRRDASVLRSKKRETERESETKRETM